MKAWIEETLSVDGWIDCDLAEPKKPCVCLLAFDDCIEDRNGEVFVGRFIDTEFVSGFTSYNDGMLEGITHWRPLPKGFYKKYIQKSQ